MVTRRRWLEAQDYERGYWRHRDHQVRTGETADLGWYEWRVNRMVEWIQRLGYASRLKASPHTALEIGNGPVGMISKISADRKVGLDPLEQFYRERGALTSVRDRSVYYLPGQGEHVPLHDRSCNLVIIDNCLDHVVQPGLVLDEARRVLTSSGLLYLTVNVRSRPGYLVHRLLSRLRIDTGHPHTFSEGRLLDVVSDHGFRPVGVRTESYVGALRAEVREDTTRGLVKGLLGITEMTSEILALREPT